MLKKMLSLILCGLLLFLFAACTPEETKTDASSVQSVGGTTQQDDVKGTPGSVVINGQALSVGMEMTDSILATLGTAQDIQTAPSCHYDGEDTIYIYDSYSLYTYANGDQDIVYLIEISGVGITTYLDIGIGVTREEVKDAYGEGTETQLSLYYAVDDTTGIRFTMDDGETVSLIEYEELASEE